MSEPDAQRLRQYVARARARRGFRDNTDVAEAAGIAYRTLVNLLAGRATRAEDAVEIALGWEAGSIKAVLAGGEPTVTEENSRPAPEVDRLPVGRGRDGGEVLRPDDFTPDQWRDLRRYAEFIKSQNPGAQ